jgi:hypothetical protein
VSGNPDILFFYACCFSVVMHILFVHIASGLVRSTWPFIHSQGLPVKSQGNIFVFQFCPFAFLFARLCNGMSLAFFVGMRVSCYAVSRQATLHNHNFPVV